VGVFNQETIFEKALEGKGLVFIKFNLFQGFGAPGDDFY
jgi:hypothetical protein